MQYDMKYKALLKSKEPLDSTTDRKLRRQALSYPLCPPNRRENATRKARHGCKKPRYKGNPRPWYS